MILGGERPQTYALDRAATGTGAFDILRDDEEVHKGDQSADCTYACNLKYSSEELLGWILLTADLS